MEPIILSRGKAFHRRVQADWKSSVKDGHLNVEHSIFLTFPNQRLSHIRRGRLDLFVDELGSFVSIVEIKSTDWDRIKAANVSRLLDSHRRQVWKYILQYVDRQKIDVCPGIIYPTSPKISGRRELIEETLNEHGLQVVWYEDM